VKAAVALEFPLKSQHAPKLLAGGRGAVAEIRVYIWRANGAAAGTGPNAAPCDQPLPDQPFMERAKGPAG
jgi:hypothetical protein